MRLVKLAVAWTIVVVVGAGLALLFGAALWETARQPEARVALGLALFVAVAYCTLWTIVWALSVVLGREQPRFLRFDEVWGDDEDVAEPS